MSQFLCVHCSVYHCSKDVGALCPSADASADVRINLPEDNCLILCLPLQKFPWQPPYSAIWGSLTHVTIDQNIYVYIYVSICISILLSSSVLLGWGWGWACMNTQGLGCQEGLYWLRWLDCKNCINIHIFLLLFCACYSDLLIIYIFV